MLGGVGCFNVYNSYPSNPLDLNESPIRGYGSKLIIGTKVLNGIDGANVTWQIYFHFAMISGTPESQIDQQFQIGMYNVNTINNSGDLPKLHIRRYTQNGGGWTNWRPMY